MIARYMVLKETDGQLLVLRPYQVYAVEEIVKRALETKNNGYIWHTTGDCVIIVTGCKNVDSIRLLETFTKNKTSCSA